MITNSRPIATQRGVVPPWSDLIQHFDERGVAELLRSGLGIELSEPEIEARKRGGRA
jgi:hypothetical protein